MTASSAMGGALWRWPDWLEREQASRVVMPLSLFVAALVVNLFHITAKSFGLDEATSVYYASQPLGSLIEILTRRDPNMSVYYFVLRGWMHGFGEGETAVRSLSAVSAALAVPAIYYLGRLLFGSAAGLLSAVLLMLNAFSVEYAQTARAYAPVMLLVILSSIAFVLELERPSRANRVAYVVASTLAFYTQYFAALVVVAHALVLLVTRRRAGLTRERWTMAAILALLWLPELVIAARVGSSARLGWVQPLSLERIHWAATAFAGQSDAVLMLLLAAGCYGLARGMAAGRAWPHVLAGAWFAVPIVVTVLVSLRTPIFVPRFLIVCVPGLILFGAAGIASIRSPTVAALLVGLVAWPAAIQVREYYGADADEDWRSATRHVLAAAKPGDAIKFFLDYNRRPFDYYGRLAGVPGPTNLERRPLTGSPRVWLVNRQYEADGRAEDFERLRSELRAQYRLVQQSQLLRVGVVLYARCRFSPHDCSLQSVRVR
ncbi:MAG: glycosyltransferase family 39 protein, partial [bacterium]